MLIKPLILDRLHSSWFFFHFFLSKSHGKTYRPAGHPGTFSYERPGMPEFHSFCV